jgi:ligand-binding SRPBCC domain-containing protein
MKPNNVDHASEVRVTTSATASGSRLEVAQFLPQPRDRVFEFFSDAFQLEEITPPWLRFSVVTPAPIRMRAGLAIDYRLRLHGIPIRWQSVISEWEPPFRFVDEQVRGPYRRWHHEHLFEIVDGGTRCTDLVDFEVPGGPLVERLFVRAELHRIFAFRQRKLSEIFAVPREKTT